MLIIAIGILLFIPITTGYNTAYNQLPLINDQWYEALQKINEKAAPDAIVNSWWDFGHWFKAIADRPVTFDGGSQDTPQAHWIGQVLLTDNEQEAVAILRMLDCGGNSAYDLIYNATNDSYNSVKLTKEIIMQTEEEAKETLLEQGLFEEQAVQILTYTHCNPPENYFITSQDMVGKAPVWAHFGSWDFNRAHVVNLVNTYAEEDAIVRIQEDLGVSEEEAQQLYFEATTNDPNNWIAPWPSYGSMPTSCWQEEELLYCSAGFFMNLTNGIVQVATNSGYNYPKQLLYINPEGELNVTDFSAGNYSPLLIAQDGRSYSVAIIPEGTGFTGFLVDTDLLQSMFTRLFFFKGHQLECFDLFDYKRTVTNEEIYVWKVDWNCTDPNVVFENAASEEK
jgi:dolichyl-diphosphooligosaccharide--protein glycosyltransferase